MIDTKNIPQVFLAAAYSRADVGFASHDGSLVPMPSEAAVQAVIDAYTVIDAQAEVIAQIDLHAKSLRDSVVAAISPAEMASWTIKQAEARAYQSSGNAADAPMLGIEAMARGVTVADLADKVLAKAVQLSQLEAMIAGVAGAHGDAVKTLGTFDAVLAYDWHTGWPI